MSQGSFGMLLLGVPMKPTDLTLTTYTKEAIKPIGLCKANVKYQGSSHGPLDLFVLKHNSATQLPRRQWLSELKRDWISIKKMHHWKKPVDKAEISGFKV